VPTEPCWRKAVPSQGLSADGPEPVSERRRFASRLLAYLSLLV